MGPRNLHPAPPLPPPPAAAEPPDHLHHLAAAPKITYTWPTPLWEPRGEGCPRASRREEPPISTRLGRTRAEPRESPLFCVSALGSLRKGIRRQIKRGARSAHSPRRSSPLPSGPGESVQGGGRGPEPSPRLTHQLTWKGVGGAGSGGRRRLRDRSRGPPPDAGHRPRRATMGSRPGQAVPCARGCARGWARRRAARGRRGKHCLGSGATQVAG